MAKNVTPAMERYRAKQTKKKDRKQISGPFKEAFKRLLRNKLAIVGMVIVILIILVAIFAPILAPFGYDDQDYMSILQGPSAAHWLGTDNFGRDILSRLIYGSRVSIPVGFICSAFSLVFGCGLGVIAAFYGGVVEEVIMRIMDVLSAIPAMLFAIAVLAALGNGTDKLIIAIGLSTLPLFARVARSAIYTVKEADYIESSRAIGAGSFRLMLRHMLPNALGPIIVITTFSVAMNILVVSSLSYLGLGIVPPTAEWGSILASAKTYITTAPHFIIFPGVIIMITVFALNLLGDGVRDAFDPKLK